MKKEKRRVIVSPLLSVNRIITDFMLAQYIHKEHKLLTYFHVSLMTGICRKRCKLINLLAEHLNYLLYF